VSQRTVGRGKLEIAELRTELRAETAELRTELRTEIAELRAELRTEIASARTEIANLRTEMEASASRQLRWMVGTILAGTALAVTLVELI
jgi:F0F1-type ATP synthase membrane subunit b/b'